jgi:hypothetical protein
MASQASAGHRIRATQTAKAKPRAALQALLVLEARSERTLPRVTAAPLGSMERPAKLEAQVSAAPREPPAKLEVRASAARQEAPAREVQPVRARERQEPTDQTWSKAEGPMQEATSC